MKKLPHILIILLALSAPYAHAQTTNGELAITPVVIDEKAKARDILKETLMLKNTSNHTLFLYPLVNDINPNKGEQQFSLALDSTGLANSLANWIELSRGVITLSPGEERAVPFVIRINFNAVPATYHSQISFENGATRAEADAHGPVATVAVNVEVQADIRELLQLNKYTTDSVFLSGDDVMFNYALQNIGNQELQPKGEIRIYDRKGQEVADVDVNREGKSISPEQVSQMASVWNAAQGFGRYKALLSVQYGSQEAAVQDTTFFWVVPWKQMLILFLFTLAAIVVLSIQFHNWLERRHLYKFAHAGLLNDHTMRKIEEEFEPEPLVRQPRATPAPESLRSTQPSAAAVVIPKPEAVKPQPVMRHEAMVHPLTQQTPSVRSEHRSLREVLTKDAPRAHTSGAINLKAMHAKEPEPHASLRVHIPQKQEAPVAHGHVISLKKK